MFFPRLKASQITSDDAIIIIERIYSKTVVRHNLSWKINESLSFVHVLLVPAEQSISKVLVSVENFLIYFVVVAALRSKMSGWRRGEGAVVWRS